MQESILKHRVLVLGMNTYKIVGRRKACTVGWACRTESLNIMGAVTFVTTRTVSNWPLATETPKVQNLASWLLSGDQECLCCQCNVHRGHWTTASSCHCHCHCLWRWDGPVSVLFASWKQHTGRTLPSAFLILPECSRFMKSISHLEPLAARESGNEFLAF